MSSSIYTHRLFPSALPLAAVLVFLSGACSRPKPAPVHAASAARPASVKQETSTKKGSLSGSWGASYNWSNGGTGGQVRLDYKFLQNGTTVTGTRNFYERSSDNNAEQTECQLLSPLTGELKGDRLTLTMGVPTEKSEGCEKYDGPDKLELTWDPELEKLVETVWGGPENEEMPVELTRD